MKVLLNPTYLTVNKIEKSLLEGCPQFASSCNRLQSNYLYQTLNLKHSFLTILSVRKIPKIRALRLFIQNGDLFDKLIFNSFIIHPFINLVHLDTKHRIMWTEWHSLYTYKSPTCQLFKIWICLLWIRIYVIFRQQNNNRIISKFWSLAFMLL